MSHILRALCATMLSLGLATGGLTTNAGAHDGAGDATTKRIAKRIGVRPYEYQPWFATTLDIGCGDRQFTRHRHAEIVKIPRGHGKRFVGVIHVDTARKARWVAGVLLCQGVWFAQKGGRFVLPLRSATFTDGGSRSAFQRAAFYAKRELGDGWRVR